MASVAKTLSPAEKQEMAYNGRIGKPPKFKVVNVEWWKRPGEKRQKIKLTDFEEQYFSDLHALIDEIFGYAYKAFGWNWNDLAYHAGVSNSTTAKLGERQTRFPMFTTVYKLAAAVGWTLWVKEVRGRKKPEVRKPRIARQPRKQLKIKGRRRKGTKKAA